MGTVRKAAVAGLFYPDDKIELQNLITTLLNTAECEEQFENIYGIVAPHAGYLYSGKTAAYAFNAIADKNYETVIIISPSHREYFKGISVYEGDGYETPLGVAEVNQKMRESLLSENIFEGIQGHRSEHAIEVEIPFLQSVLNDFSIVPIVIGDQNKIFIDELADSLCKIADEKTLIVASSDLSHFYSREEAKIRDNKVIERIEDFDFDGLQNDLELRNSEACGGGAIVSLMKSAQLNNTGKSKVLSYSDSGKVTGDISEVVGYLSAVFYN